MSRLSLVAVAVLTMGAGLQPDVPGALNPGVTQDNVHQTICTKGWSRRMRPDVAPIKQRLLQQYYPAADPRRFELDHRVAIEVGGCPYCLTNLWLQSWRDPKHHQCKPQVMMDAACKDRLENFVHRQICTDHMTLAQGQDVLLGDWIAGYRQTFER